MPDTICGRCRRSSVFVVPGVLCGVNGCGGHHLPVRVSHRRFRGGHATIRERVPDLRFDLEPAVRDDA